MDEHRKQVREYIVRLFHALYQTDVPPSLVEQYEAPVLHGATLEQAHTHIAAIGTGTLKAYLAQQGFPYGIAPPKIPSFPSFPPVSSPAPATSPPAYSPTSHSSSVFASLPPSHPGLSAPLSSPSYASPALVPSSFELEAAAHMEATNALNNLDPVQIRDYVDTLYKTFTGRLGDPASTNYLVRSLLDKSFSFSQAELHVRYSKEGKAYAVKKKQVDEEQKQQKLKNYVSELYRVYMHYPLSGPFTGEMQEMLANLQSGAMSLQDAEDDLKLKTLESLKPPSKPPAKN
eukprot:TRINITY_DN11786_c0_g1_i4.p3 TRINITY_DN11786_c0_g1~~TRINITY_DN11786_c0_g1_i4.p3  ORF type:complete len:288 (-),score=79.87 TRINITY_DN11786_c0_g1_i4:8-871(-)